MFTKLLRMLQAIFRRDQAEREMDAELRFHLDMETKKNMRRGMSEKEARQAALRSFGGVELTKEQCRDARGGRLVETTLQDLRYGARVLKRNPGFTLVALLTLTLGIGANTAIFSVIYGVLMRPLPYAEGNRLVIIHQQAPLARIDDMGFSVKEINDYREQSQTLDGVVEHHSMSFLLLDGEEAQRVATAVVSANFFDVLGVKALYGRTFLPSDDVKGADAVLVLSNNYWRQQYKSDPNIVGRVFRMKDRPHTVIGVLPPIPEYPSESDVYMPTVACPTRSGDRFIANRTFRMMNVFGKLKPTATVEQAQADLSVVASNGNTLASVLSAIVHAPRKSRLRGNGRALARRVDQASEAYLLDPARHGGAGAADRLRECGEPYTGAIDAARARDGHPRGDGGGARAVDSPDAHGEHDAVAHGRRARPGGRRLGLAVARELCRTLHAARARDQH